MIRSIYFPPKGTPKRDLSPSEMVEILKEPDSLLWVSIERSEPEDAGKILQDVFHFHPLAIEDCQSIGYQPSKVDDFNAYLFMIFHALAPNLDFRELQTVEINVFVGPNYLVTSHHAELMPPVEAVWKRINRDERVYSNGSDFLCHAILDALVDDYMPVLDLMDEEIESLEDQVLSKPEPQTLARILSLKHSVMTLRRIVAPQRETINRLSRDDFPQIDHQSQIYFRDIYDHLVRIQDLSESIRDIVSGTLDIYLNSTSLRLNEVMKALTIVSTIFLPLSFVAGVYGMNFEYIPELSWRWGYAYAWVIFIAIFAGMLIFFKKRGWF